MAVRAVDFAHRHIGLIAQALDKILAARAEVAARRALVGSGNWPGMETSGLSFLFVPGIGIERNRPCV